MNKIKKGIQWCFMVLSIGYFLLPVFSVRAAEDLSALTASRDAVNAAIANEATYEADSYSAFFQAITDLGGVAGITTIINENTISQVQADALQESIDDALAGLITLLTYTNIKAIYDTANAVVLTGYTPSSQTLYTNELARINLILENPTAGEVAILALETDLDQADSLLVLKADTTDLVAAENQATIAYYDDRADYTVSSHTAFREAVNDYGNYLYVNSVLSDANVSQATVDLLTTQINAALDLLVLKADTSSLESAYDIEIQKDVSNYTPESIEIYTAELERIRQIMVSDDTSQVLCDQTLIDLDNAETLLVLKADKTELVKIQNKALDYNPGVYSVTSYHILDVLLIRTNTMLLDDNALQTAVDQMITDIQSAITGLKKKVDEQELFIGKQGIDVDEFVTLGAAHVLSYYSSNPNIASIDGNGMVTPLAFGRTTITVTLDNGVIETIPVFVKEVVSPLTLIMVSTLPVISVVLAVGLILVRSRPIEIVQRIRIQKKKKKEPKSSPEPVSEEKKEPEKPAEPIAEVKEEPAAVQPEPAAPKAKKTRKKPVETVVTEPEPVKTEVVVPEQMPLEEPEMKEESPVSIEPAKAPKKTTKKKSDSTEQKNQ